jgi:RNA recognition motif-containing protein
MTRVVSGGPFRETGPCTRAAPRYGPTAMGIRLYVGNLAVDATADLLRAAFSKFGEVTDVQVVVDRYSGRVRGFAFVTMASEAQAAQAVVQLNGADLGGRPVRVSESPSKS